MGKIKITLTTPLSSIQSGLFSAPGCSLCLKNVLEVIKISLSAIFLHIQGNKGNNRNNNRKQQRRFPTAFGIRETAHPFLKRSMLAWLANSSRKTQAKASTRTNTRHVH